MNKTYVTRWSGKGVFTLYSSIFQTIHTKHMRFTRFVFSLAFATVIAMCGASVSQAAQAQPIIEPRASEIRIANVAATIHGVRYKAEYQPDASWLLIVPDGTDVRMLAVTFDIPAGAICVPPSGSTVDFSQPFLYTVTSADGLSKAHHEVVVRHMNPQLSGSIGKSEADCEYWDNRTGKRERDQGGKK